VFGRLKLVLVALVLMPSAAFAADQAPRHAPGAPVASIVGATKAAEPAAEPAERSRKHHPSASTKAAQPGSSTIAMFLDGLRDETPAPAPAGAKQAALAAVSAVAAPARPAGHQRS